MELNKAIMKSMNKKDLVIMILLISSIYMLGGLFAVAWDSNRICVNQKYVKIDVFFYPAYKLSCWLSEPLN